MISLVSQLVQKKRNVWGRKLNVRPVFTNRYLACYFNSLLRNFFLFFKKSRSVPYLGNFRQFRGEKAELHLNVDKDAIIVRTFR